MLAKLSTLLRIAINLSLHLFSRGYNASLATPTKQPFLCVGQLKDLKSFPEVDSQNLQVIYAFNESEHVDDAEALGLEKITQHFYVSASSDVDLYIPER